MMVIRYTAEIAMEAAAIYARASRQEVRSTEFGKKERKKLQDRPSQSCRIQREKTAKPLQIEDVHESSLCGL